MDTTRGALVARPIPISPIREYLGLGPCKSDRANRVGQRVDQIGMAIRPAPEKTGGSQDLSHEFGARMPACGENEHGVVLRTARNGWPAPTDALDPRGQRRFGIQIVGQYLLIQIRTPWGKAVRTGRMGSPFLRFCRLMNGLTSTSNHEVS